VLEDSSLNHLADLHRVQKRFLDKQHNPDHHFRDQNCDGQHYHRFKHTIKQQHGNYSEARR
jgi:hypothetical protein